MARPRKPRKRDYAAERRRRRSRERADARLRAQEVADRLALIRRRRRDYRAEYARRQERARALGFAGYYERRTRAAPGGEKPPPGELARLRGHGRKPRPERGAPRERRPPSERRQMLAYIGDGTLIQCDIRAVVVEDLTRAGKPRKRRFRSIPKLLVPADGRPPKEFTLRDMDERMLLDTIDEEQARGGILSPARSLDQRRVLEL